MEMKSTMLVVAVAWMALSARAEVSIANVFASGGMIPCGVKSPFWGGAEPGEHVKVTVSNASGGKAPQTCDAVAADDGEWMVELSPLEAGERYHLTAEGKDSKAQIHHVLAGDVWLYVGRFRHRWHECEKPVLSIDALGEQAKDVFSVARAFACGGSADLPQRQEFQNEVAGRWCPFYGWTVSGFYPGIGTCFVAELCRARKIPVGLISAASLYPHTAAYYLPAEAIVKDPVLGKTPDAAKLLARTPGTKESKALNARRIAYMEQYLKDAEAASSAKQTVRLPDFPEIPKSDATPAATFYNAMIHPVTPMAIKGVIYYEPGGLKSIDGYAETLSNLVGSLRKAFRNPDLPFFIVQSAAYDGQWKNLSAIQEIQQDFVDHDKNADLLVLNDFGKGKTPNPTQKPAIAKRLLALALKRVYGDSSQITEYPRVVGCKSEPGKLVLTFSMPLKTSDGLPPSGFAIGGSDSRFAPASAELKGNALILAAPGIDKPIHASYCWENKALRSAPNVIGENTMPLAPFRASAQQ